MAGKTISEKILSTHSNRDARAGDVVVCRVDSALGTDGSMPMAIDYFTAMGGKRVAEPERIVIALDHYPAGPLHDRIRAFAAEQGIHLWEAGEGIGHQLIIESGRATPGGLVVGADSHAVTYGARNCFATGIGSSDLAAIMLCGRIWLQVPETIRVILTSAMHPGVDTKDVALVIAGILGADGATYEAVEFAGPAAQSMPADDRLVLCNMSVEMGAKNAIFSGAVESDRDARYARELSISLAEVTPQLALPHQVDRVIPRADAIGGTPIHMVYLGTCTGGRARDFREALRVIREGGGVAPGVRLIVTPASRAVQDEISGDGTLDALLAYGAVLQAPGCGSCCGTCGEIPGDGVNVISTANRNFKGRMGNGQAFIYLASPATCAGAAVKGSL